MKLRITVDGVVHEVEVEVLPADEAAVAPASRPTASSPSSPSVPPPPRTQAVTADSVCAPMAGTVTAIAVKLNQTVEVGQALLTLEAMKMESVVSAPRAGRVRSLEVDVSTAVSAGQALLTLE